jgi:DNA-binding transcriptional regulator YbjK
MTDADEVLRSSPPRKRDGDERRRELCDAAINVLAEHGSRGLTHGQVDRYAGVPDGTTSYYYRTRAALLRGVGKRVADIDVANLRSVSDEPLDPQAPFSHLARLVIMQSHGEGLALNRARHELLLSAARDPDLAETSQEFIGRIIAMAHGAIAHLQPDNDDPALLEAQTTAVTTFIAGVFTRLVAGDRTINDARQLARFMQAVVTAVALERMNDDTVKRARRP